MQIQEEKCSESLEETKTKGSRYNELFQEVKDESSRLETYLIMVVERAIVKDHLDVESLDVALCGLLSRTIIFLPSITRNKVRLRPLGPSLVLLELYWQLAF